MFDYLTDNNNSYILDSNNQQIDTANITIHYVNTTVSYKADITNSLLRYRLIDTSIDIKYDNQVFAYRNIYTSWYLTSIEGYITDSNGNNIESVELESINIEQQVDVNLNRYRYVDSNVNIKTDISNQLLRYRYLNSEIAYKMDIESILRREREVNATIDYKIEISNLFRKKIAAIDVIYTKYKEN